MSTSSSTTPPRCTSRSMTRTKATGTGRCAAACPPGPGPTRRRGNAATARTGAATRRKSWWGSRSRATAFQFRINIIDPPGHVDFTVEVERSLRVLDGAVTLLDSVAGVEPQTETVWRQADRYTVPRIVFANKMDRVGANFDRCLAMVRDRLTKKAYPLQIPVGSGETFTGHIDILRRVEIVFDEATLGKTFTEMPVADAYRERVEQLRHEAIEAAVESDDALMEKYLGGEELSFEEIQRA